MAELLAQVVLHHCCIAVLSLQARHGGIPHNPYRRSHDTRWSPDIATGALFPQTSQPSSQQHPSLHSQQLHSGASTQSALYTGDSMTKAQQSRHSAAKHNKLNSKSSKLRSSSGLHSGDNRPQPELNSAMLRSMQGGGHSQAAAPAALHSGHSTVYPMLHTSHQPTSALHSGHSVTHPELDPPQLRYPSTMQDQYAAGNAMYAGSSCLHESSKQQQNGMEPSQQQPMSAIYTGDSHAHPMLSSSTPDRQELPYTGRHSSPSCDSVQDRAERQNAFGPVPTAPPSTVSRNGRIVERAAKARLLSMLYPGCCTVLQCVALCLECSVSPC